MQKGLRFDGHGFSLRVSDGLGLRVHRWKALDVVG